MADFMDNNRLDAELNNIINSIENISSSFQTISDRQNAISKALTDVSNDTLDNLSKILVDSEKDLKDLIDTEKEVRAEAIKEEKKIRERYLSDLKDINEKVLKNDEEINALRKLASEEENKTVRDSLNIKAKLLEEENKQLALQAEISRLRSEGLNDEAAKIEATIAAVNLQVDEYSKLNEKEIEKRKGFINSIADVGERYVKQLTNTLESAISSVTSTYNQYAGTLASSLNTSVNDISKLQKDIADNLNSEGLSKAISNVQVMLEAASLVSSGYTNEAKLQQSATDIEIGQRIAPNIDFSSSSVKNLINAIGPDFTQRFSAIQAAVQETAGSTASMAYGFNGFVSNMEPVFLNAQYSLAASEGGADVEATLSTALENRIIQTKDVEKYRSMILELMDPYKAYNSNNMAVRIAATSGYDFNGNPMDALRAIMGGRNTYYSNFDLSGTSPEAATGRSFGAAFAGDDTFSATYNPQSLVGLVEVNTRNLDDVYRDKLTSLESGEYTTVEEAIKNTAENSDIVQTISKIAEIYPRMYNVVSGIIVSKIDSLPLKLAELINNKFSSTVTNSYSSSKTINNSTKNRTGNKSSSSSNDISTTINNVASSSSFLQKMQKVNTWTPGMNSGTKIGTAVQNVSKAVGGRVGGVALASYGAGIMGTIDVVKNFKEEGFFKKDDPLGSASNYAGIGSAIGSLIAPGIGTAIGAALGGLVGAGGSLIESISESNRLTKERNRLQEEENKLLNEAGVTKLSSFEANSIVAQGGGTVDTSKGVFKIAMHATGLDKVPYDDYLALLHKDEAVVTASAAKELRRADPNFWNMPSMQRDNINNDEIVYNLKEQTKNIVDAIKGNDNNQSLTVDGPKQYVIKNKSLS